MKQVSNYCKDCGTIDNLNDYGGVLLCDNCIDYYHVCNDCNSIIEEYGAYWIRDEGYGEFPVCGDCIDGYNYCDVCGDYTSDHVYHDGNTTACYSCLERGAVHVCDNCDEIVEEVHCNDNGCYCAYCYDEQDDELLHEYHSGPRNFNIHALQGEVIDYDTITLGVEVETEFKYDRYEASQEVYDEGLYEGNFFVPEHDGSLLNGIEFISVPCTLRRIKEGKEFKKLFSILKKYGANNEGARAGCHVHVGRNALQGEDDILKLTTILYRYSETFQRVAGREFTYYSQSIPLERTALCEYASLERLRENASYTYHTDTINVSRRTVEIRLFSGATSFGDVALYTEFLHFMITRLKDYTLEDVKTIPEADFFSPLRYAMRGVYSTLYNVLTNLEVVSLASDQLERERLIAPSSVSFNDIALEYGNRLLAFTRVFPTIDTTTMQGRIVNIYQFEPEVFNQIVATV